MLTWGYYESQDALSKEQGRMNVATAPATPENAKSPPIFRRAFTVPTRFAGGSKTPAPLREAEAQGAETLFAHEHCRIVSFSTGFRRPSSSGSGYNGNLEDDPVGTLPWASLTERTIAAGKFHRPTIEGPADECSFQARYEFTECSKYAS